MLNDLKIKSEGLYDFSREIHFSREGLHEFKVRFNLAVLTKNKFCIVYQDFAENRFVFKLMPLRVGVRNINFYKEAPEWYATFSPADSNLIL